MMFPGHASQELGKLPRNGAPARHGAMINTRMGRAAGKSDDVHQHSGWLIPLGLAIAILGFCGLFLGWYLRPGPRAGTAPTGQSTIVHLEIRGATFAIPANFLENSRTRAGGEQDSIAVAALFPSFRGYSDADAPLFAGNAPDQPVIHLLLRGDPNNLAPEARLARLYMPYITEPKGAAGPFGLTQYSFRKASGYEQNDLFAGQGDKGLLLVLCERPASELASPNCVVSDRPMAANLSYSYRFKRAYLSRWREMASGVNQLIARFEQKS